MYLQDPDGRDSCIVIYFSRWGRKIVGRGAQGGGADPSPPTPIAGSATVVPAPLYLNKSLFYIGAILFYLFQRTSEAMFAPPSVGSTESIESTFSEFNEAKRVINQSINQFNQLVK